MSSVKQKTVSGLFWSLADSLASQGILFIVGIVLANLLSPSEFGLVGMITIFIAVSETLINSGFSQALIRKKDCTEAEYSTVFIFNFFVGCVLFLALIFAAPSISGFFNEPRLTMIIRVLAIVLIIDALSMVQRTVLVKRIDFKLQTRITVIAAVLSGTLGIWMAYNGFGVWSLVAKTVCQKLLNTILLWVWNRWRPVMIFDKGAFRSMFSFSSRLLIVGIINTLFQNIYYLIIGKYFKAAELGYYSRGDQFTTLISTNVAGVVSRVSYPVLSGLQDDPDQLLSVFRKLLKSTMLVAFFLMLIMASVSESMVLTLIGEKWLATVPYLQLLCFTAVFAPLLAMNQDLLMVKGRSDLILRYEIFRKVLVVPVIVTGIFSGIETMIACMIAHAFVSYIMISLYVKKVSGYGFFDQCSDLLYSFLLCVFVAGIVFSMGLYFQTLNHTLTFLLQLFIGLFSLIGISELLKFNDYLTVRKVIFETFSNKMNRR